MMNTKLKADKQIIKKKKAEERARKKGIVKDKNGNRGKSKFSNKYSERIASIRESEQLSERRKKLAERTKTTSKARKATKEKEEKTTTRRKRSEATQSKSTKSPSKARSQTTSRAKQKSSKTRTSTHTAKRMKTKADLKAEMEALLKNNKLNK